MIDVMFFMNTETGNDTLKEGICFGFNFGEAKHSDKQDDEKEKDKESEVRMNDSICM